jgi:hypothetical protein
MKMSLLMVISSSTFHMMRSTLIRVEKAHRNAKGSYDFGLLKDFKYIERVSFKRKPRNVEKKFWKLINERGRKKPSK